LSDNKDDKVLRSFESL